MRKPRGVAPGAGPVDSLPPPPYRSAALLAANPLLHPHTRTATSLARTLLLLALFGTVLQGPVAARAEGIETDDVAQPANDGQPAASVPATELRPIVVDAARPADAPLVERRFDTPDDLTGFGETIEAEPVWRSFQSPGELLGQSVGAQLQRQGGREDFATLSIRGAPSGQLRILLDGVALGRASDSVVNLADLPVDTVERIEVYRGFAPVGLTPTSAAGVVNVVTRDPKDPVATAAVGGGSFGSAKANAGGAGPVAGGNGSAFASYRHSEGDFRYKDDNGTLNNSADDKVLKRRNNDSDTVESLLRWRRDVFDTARLQLREHIFFKDEGVPGIARPYASTGRLQTTRNVASASVGGRDQRWNVEEDVTWERQRLSDFGAVDNTGETTSSTTIGRWSRPLGASHFVSGSGDFTWEGFEQSLDSSARPDQEASRSSLAVGIGDDWTIDAIDTTLTFQLRQQNLWNDHNAAVPGGSGNAQSTDPRVGLRWNVFGDFDVKANASSYFRPPTFDEMFGTDGFTTGNPALKPEQGIAWDAGFEWKGSRDPFGSLSTSYAYYGSDIDDVIVVLLTFDRTAKAFNAAKARIHGHEARVEWKGPAGLAVSANYTYQDAENRSDAAYGKALPSLPPHELYARLSWTWRRLVLAYDVEYSSSTYRDFENFTKVPSRTEHGLSLVYGPIWKGFRVSLEADNLGNTMIPDPLGYPLPNRAFYATISWSTPPADGGGDEG